jgi:beta-lactamase superfamily II metal-dependent hydrolase
VKITHHGSSSGTAKRVLEAVKRALAIASTADEGGHRLEQDTLDWLLGPQKKRRVFETLVDGDITVRTDGEPYRGGVLYQVGFTSPGEFAHELHAEVVAADQIGRTRSDDPDCR